MLIQQGKLIDATVLLRRIIKLADESMQFQVNKRIGGSAEIFLEWNMLEEADRKLLHAIN